VRQQFVRLGEARGDFVPVHDGLGADKEVVVAGAFKLRNGMAVAVKPDVKPAPELAPHPENR
jgi:membrane fusion protein, multidrug efflux system